MNKPVVTIFTATYNRAHLLNRLYTSLVNQTNRDFEWVIVDDGSTDNTKEVIDGFINDNIISIRYFHQINGGKHRAINQGVKLANGHYFFIVDSDDILTKDAVQFIELNGVPLLCDTLFAGIIGVKSLYSGEQIVKSKEDIIDASTISLHYYHNLKGDKAEVFKTEVLSEFLFPDFCGEVFCSESLVWNRIALKYNMRFINKTIYLCDYLQDGLSFNSLKLRSNNPTYALLNYQESIFLDIPLKFRIKSALNYYRFYFHYKRKYDKNFVNIKTIPLLFTIAKPIGFFIFLLDRYKL